MIILIPTSIFFKASAIFTCLPFGFLSSVLDDAVGLVLPQSDAFEAEGFSLVALVGRSKIINCFFNS